MVVLLSESTVALLPRTGQAVGGRTSGGLVLPMSAGSRPESRRRRPTTSSAH